MSGKQIARQSGGNLKTSRSMTALVLAFAISTQAAIAPALAAQAAAGPITPSLPDIPEVSCSKGIYKAKLSASSVTVGDPAYIEFRSRLTTLIPSGHMFVVFGRLDPEGEPVSSHIVGLFPKGSFLGMYGGAVAWGLAQRLRQLDLHRSWGANGRP